MLVGKSSQLEKTKNQAKRLRTQIEKDAIRKQWRVGKRKSSLLNSLYKTLNELAARGISARKILKLHLKEIGVSNILKASTKQLSGINGRIIESGY